MQVFQLKTVRYAGIGLCAWMSYLEVVQVFGYSMSAGIEPSETERETI